MTGDYFNLDTRRAFKDVVFGCACYSVDPLTSGDEEQVTLRHAGVAACYREARRWCDGDDSVSLVKVYGSKDA